MICFGRHQPQNWMMYALNGAEIIFNPSAELCGNLSDKNWFIEGRAEAVANSVYTVTVIQEKYENSIKINNIFFLQN